MFEFFGEYHKEFINTTNCISTISKLISTIAIVIGLIVAWINLNGLKRAQKLQALMNLISIETDFNNNLIKLQTKTKIYTQITTGKIKPTDIEVISRSLEKTQAFDEYITSADKLASLLSSSSFYKYFGKKNDDFTEKYTDKFNNVKILIDGEGLIFGKNELTRNIDILLEKWKSEKKSEI